MIEFITNSINKHVIYTKVRYIFIIILTILKYQILILASENLYRCTIDR